MLRLFKSKIRDPKSKIFSPNGPISTSRPFPRIDGQIAIGHLEDDQRHAGGVIVAEVTGPVTGRALPADELIADSRIPVGPVITTGEEHRLDGVIVAVIVMAFHVHLLAIGTDALGMTGDELLDVFQAALQIIAFKNTGVIVMAFHVHLLAIGTDALGM